MENLKNKLVLIRVSVKKNIQETNIPNSHGVNKKSVYHLHITVHFTLKILKEGVTVEKDSH